MHFTDTNSKHHTVKSSENVDAGLNHLEEVAIFPAATCQVGGTLATSVPQVCLNIRMKQQQLQRVSGMAV
jgi:hypothetical protein